MTRPSEDESNYDTIPIGIPMPTIRPRQGLPQNRPRSSRYSTDSDASSLAGLSTPQLRAALGLGLRPPPPAQPRSQPHPQRANSFRGSMPPIPGSPIDESETDLSPILSGLPPPPSHQQSGDISNEDEIAEEHKRVPELIPRSPASPRSPRSPLSPLSPARIGLGLASMARRAVAARKPVPAPVTVVHVVHHHSVSVPVPVIIGIDSAGGRGMNSKSGFVYASEKAEHMGFETVELASPVLFPPPVPEEKERAKPKRKTMWEGWWDLGLLERMNTVRRKK